MEGRAELYGLRPTPDSDRGDVAFLVALLGGETMPALVAAFRKREAARIQSFLKDLPATRAERRARRTVLDRTEREVAARLYLRLRAGRKSSRTAVLEVNKRFPDAVTSEGALRALASRYKARAAGTQTEKM